MHGNPCRSPQAVVEGLDHQRPERPAGALHTPLPCRRRLPLARTRCGPQHLRVERVPQHRIVPAAASVQSQGAVSHCAVDGEESSEQVEVVPPPIPSIHPRPSPSSDIPPEGAQSDVIKYCGCNASCPGVSVESHKFLTRPSRHRRLYRPRPGRLATLISTPGHLKPELTTKVKEEVLQLIKDPDDDIVPEGGSGPREVHLNDTDYPSTRRIRMGLCFGDSLAYYPGCPRVETTTCRHITPTMYEMSVALWRLFWHALPACCQTDAPDLIAVQPFDFARGDKMGYHTDSLPTHPGQPTSVRQGSPVSSVLEYTSDYRVLEYT